MGAGDYSLVVIVSLHVPNVYIHVVLLLLYLSVGVVTVLF